MPTHVRQDQTLRQRAQPWVGVGAGYLLLAIGLTWPLVLHLQDWAVGWPSPDAMDTAQLRRVVSMGLDAQGQSTELFSPAGYPALALMPNLLDHVLAMPLVRLLPWPLADNLWWLLILTLNGIAGHLVGWGLGRSHRHGVLCGVALACAEPVLREANLGHAPQSMVFSGALVVLFLARSADSKATWRDGVGLGASMALAGLTYWYFGLFYALLCLPVGAAMGLRPRSRSGLRGLALGAGVCGLLVAMPLASALSGWEQLAMTERSMLPEVGRASLQVLPADERFVFTQGGDLFWPFRSEPPDRSNRLSLLLLAAAVWGSRAVPRARWRWWAAAAVGGLMLMGPFLALAGDPVLVGGRPVALPGHLLAELSPVLARLHWPQRWGVVVTLALLPLAARCPRPLALGGLLLVETLAFSHHAPLGHTPVSQFAGWRALSVLSDERSVLVFPVERAPDQMALLGYAYRAAEQPLVAETRLPAGAAPPDAWRATVEALGVRGPVAPITVEDLDALGIGAVVLDTTPGGPLHPREVAGWEADIAQRLPAAMGPPVDLGSVRVWWVHPPASAPTGLANPDAWRAAQFRALAEYDQRLQASAQANFRFPVPREYAVPTATPRSGRR